MNLAILRENTLIYKKNLFSVLHFVLHCCEIVVDFIRNVSLFFLHCVLIYGF